MSRQLPQNNVPLLPGNSNKQPIRIPSKHRPPTLAVLLTIFIGLLACGIFVLAGVILFPDIGFPIPTTVVMPASEQLSVDTNFASTQQAFALTQTAFAQIIPEQQEQVPVVASPTPYPTYTSLPTYTPGIIPIIQTSTNTPEPNLIYEDNFDNGINTAYWQVFGTWMIADGNPVVVESYKSERKLEHSAFANPVGGLIFPGTAQMDNIAVECDLAATVGVLLSFVDEYNYKSFGISQDGIGSFAFISNGNRVSIPQSSVNFPKNNPTHARIEIRGNSLKVYINQKLTYDFKNLPDVVTGSVGFIWGNSSPALLNFKVYQLP